jgi:hypothetical protein
MSRKRHCTTCNNTGWVPVDPNDLKRGDINIWMTYCQACCNHDEGFWHITARHSETNAGKWACNNCGIVVDKRPKNTDYKGNFVEKTTLLEL